MPDPKVVMITGTRKGIGKALVEHYCSHGYHVVGCSRSPIDYNLDNYQHYCVDVADEAAVKKLFFEVRKTHSHLDILINNAGIASMNHALLTPLTTVDKILRTNILGTFLFCRESAKLMKKNNYGRIVNFVTVATPLKLVGEAAYAASKAAVVCLTEILAHEFAEFGITVNAIGPTPIRTSLIAGVPETKIGEIIRRQAIQRYGEYRDVSNVIDFFIRPESDFITGQVMYLGGVA